MQLRTYPWLKFAIFGAAGLFLASSLPGENFQPTRSPDEIPTAAVRDSATDTEVPLQVRLGYPADTKLLIINADDLAVSHSEDDASFSALDHKWVSSATVMVPCPWFTEVAEYAKAHPDADLGLHLTLTSEWKTYRWGPVAPRSSVSSLVGPDGNFYSTADDVVKHAKLDEVEIEVRAQIERAITMGLKPTHLDAHMHTLYKTPEFFGVLLKVSHEYKLPIRMGRNVEPFDKIYDLAPATDPRIDGTYSPLEDVPATKSGWLGYYTNLIKNLKPGVNEVFIHLAHDDAESQAIMITHVGWGSAWRARELATIQRPEIRKTLEANHVKVIGWRDIQKLMQ
jgi:chitin disaccharide deacetylase